MDLYVILGLDHGATESDIKKAYRRLARRYHPDINPGDRTAELRFRQIVEAYETLIDPDRRSRYEQGAADPGSPARASGFEGFDFSIRGAEHSVTFGDLFAEVLSERTARGRAQERGADLHLTIQVTFEESFAGVSKRVSVTRRESCRDCAGTGLSRAPAPACVVCQGAGSVKSVRGHMVFSRRCAACGGAGHQRPRGCERCGGSGQTMHAETITVAIPAGIADGDRVRVDGRGNSGLLGGPAGDLYLTVAVAPHPRFRRDGQHVHVTVGVGVHEAALGARIDVPSPEGDLRMKVPAGTQSGQLFRLRERGMPSPRDGTRGDLVVQVLLTLPAVLDERSKELLREFGRINGHTAREVPASASGAPGLARDDGMRPAEEPGR